ncbi:MAG: SpoIIE family protein phosphatase [Pseudomonadales bacterium]|jgi:serine phosphatase RsbU (regulator of sigma subunit)|nr:SpoIIE family protein phosphatase [Pseudomonadales bacterium]MDP6471754.1 SpoIIE family protein phosphatase [Pseudomonadales bacterium]MDP6971414.1 SpoIIE family protein phosphatase [Pseudomonadales bacterium]|tara:strand:- start:3666 stop:4763 length:1098 start_codon:yes stop_codon:yes gene_type:complete
MSLLVVEGDCAATRIAEELRALGYETSAADNLKTARESCDHSPVELVVCDDLDCAIELAGDFAYLPIVLATPDVSRDILMRSVRAGLADLWALPVDANEIAERADSVLKRAKHAAGQAAARLEQYVNDLQRDQRAGRYIQLGMLPPNPMAIDRYRLRHRIKPSLILSGDFVDYFRISERYFAFYVADVSGHGASSAFVTVLLKNFSRRLRREYRPSMLEDPGEILAWLNRELLEQEIDKHVAMFLAVGDLEHDSVCFANAGHFPPAILVSRKGARYLEQIGKPIGLFEKVEYNAETVELCAGERLVVFTDGILEIMEQSTLPEKEQVLLDVVQEGVKIENIWSVLQVDEHTCPDDITCLTVVRED